MKKEKRTVQFDNDLEIEAYHFEGIMQKFPNHFHEHYVLGFVESGCRFLTCKNKEYTIDVGWRCLNIEKDVMRRMTEEITGANYLPIFTSTVASRSDAISALRDVHDMIMKEAKGFQKEETFYFLIEQLIADYTKATDATLAPISGEIQTACDYMENNFAETVTLADLSRISGLNKYTLLRNFTMQRGITPYQYLSTVRVNQAKKSPEAGISPIEAALQCGFTDQSHFTRFFRTFIGITPKRYQDIFKDDNERPNAKK